MKDFRTIRVERGQVTTVVFDRPERLNALDDVMFQELQALFAELTARPPRALVLTGAGRAFCAGADLREGGIEGLDAADRGRRVAERLRERMNPMILSYVDLPCPKVAAVNGVAAGGGASLALLADIVVAARSASFVQVFGPKLAIVPDLGFVEGVTAFRERRAPRFGEVS